MSFGAFFFTFKMLVLLCRCNHSLRTGLAPLLAQSYTLYKAHNYFFHILALSAPINRAKTKTKIPLLHERFSCYNSSGFETVAAPVAIPLLNV